MLLQLWQNTVPYDDLAYTCGLTSVGTSGAHAQQGLLKPLFPSDSD